MAIFIFISFTERGIIFLWGCNKFGQCGVDPATEFMLKLPSQLKLPEEMSRTDNGQKHLKVVSVAAGWTHMIFKTGKITEKFLHALNIILDFPKTQQFVVYCFKCGSYILNCFFFFPLFLLLLFLLLHSVLNGC